MGGSVSSNGNKYKSKLKCQNEVENVIPIRIKRQNQNKLDKYEQLLDRMKSIENNIYKNKNSSKTLVNENICLICGQTGTGKSTFLNYYSGQKLIKGNEHDGMNYLQLENPSNQISEIGNSQKSTTLHIIHYKSTYQQEYLYLCDGPGLQFSTDFEGNIINSFIITNTIYQASSIRFILMFAPEQYSTQGRASYFKETCKQYVQMFQQFQKYEDSIILAFNRIDKKEEDNMMEKAIDSFQKIQKDFTNDEEKLFLDMLINKIKRNQYFLFDYTQNGEDLKDIQQKIHKSKPLQKNLIPQYIKQSIPHNSEIELSRFLSKCREALRYCFNNYHPEQASEIVSTFCLLNDHINQMNVKEQYKMLIEEIKEQEDTAEQFKLVFSNFICMKVFDSDLSQNVVDYMRKTLQYYFFIELIKAQTKMVLKMKNTIFDITRYIQQQIYEIYVASKQSSSLEEKFHHVKKLSYIINNMQLEEDYKSICDQFGQLNQGTLQQDIFKKQNHELALKDLKQSCKKLSKEINNIMSNQLISQDLKIILKNIKFINEDRNKDKLITINNKLNYQGFQVQVYKQIREFISSLISLHTQDSPNYLKPSQFGIALEKQYNFLKFVCCSINTDNHFQTPMIQNEFEIMMEVIIKRLVSLYEEVSQKETFVEINLIYEQIFILQNLDAQLTQQVNLKDEYISFENNINQIYGKQRLQFQDNFQINCNQIDAFMSNKNQLILRKDIFENLQKNSIDLLKLSDLSQILPQIFYQDFCVLNVQLNSIITKIENEIQENINKKEYLNESLKQFQILTAIHIGFTEYSVSSYSYQISIQNKQILFIKSFSNWVKIIFDTHEVPSIQGFTLSELDKLNKSILNVTNYLTFLEIFQNSLAAPIQVIYKITIERNTYLSKQSQLMQEAGKLQPYYQQNISAICNISIVGQVDEEINKANDYLNKFRKAFNEIFKTTYSFDLENISELPKRNKEEIKSILNQLKQIYDEQHFQIIELYKINLYQNAQEIMVDHLKKVMLQILSMDQSLIQSKKQKLEELCQLKQAIDDHIPLNIDLDLEKEKRNFQANEEIQKQRLYTLLEEDKFQEAQEQLKILQGQQNHFQHQFSAKLELIQKNLNDGIEKFKKQPSLELQETILTFYRKFKEASSNFPNLIQQYEMEKVDQLMKLYALNLITKLFGYLEIRYFKMDKENEQFQSNKSDNEKNFNIIESIVKVYFQRIESYSVQHEYLLNQLKESISQKQIDVYESLDHSQSAQIDLQHNLEVLIKIHRIVYILGKKEILSSPLVKNQEAKLKILFQKHMLEQIKQYIHSNYQILTHQVKQYMIFHFQGILNFFAIQNSKIDKEIEEFIKCLQQLISKLRKSINNPKRIKKIAAEYSQSKLIHSQIKTYLQEISSIILIQCIPKKNFAKAKLLIHNLKKINQYFDQIQDPLNIKSEIQNILQNIANEILSQWHKLKEQNLKQPLQMHSTLQLIEKLHIFITNCQLEQIQNTCNLLNLITLIQDSFQNKIQEIQQSIENFDYKSTIKHYYLLEGAFKEQITFLKQKRNYIKIFDKLIQQYCVTKQYMKQNEANKLIQQFSSLKNTFNLFIENSSQQLLISFQKQFESKKFAAIVQRYEIYENFCNKINEKIENLVQHDQQIQKIYDLSKKEIKKIDSSHQINLMQLLNMQEELQINYE